MITLRPWLRGRWISAFACSRCGGVLGPRGVASRAALVARAFSVLSSLLAAGCFYAIGQSAPGKGFLALGGGMVFVVLAVIAGVWSEDELAAPGICQQCGQEHGSNGVCAQHITARYSRGRWEPSAPSLECMGADPALLRIAKASERAG